MADRWWLKELKIISATFCDLACRIESVCNRTVWTWNSQLSHKEGLFRILIFEHFANDAIKRVMSINRVSVIGRCIRNSSVPGANEDARVRQIRSRNKTVRLVISMTLAYFVSWSPYCIVSLIGTAMGHESVSPSLSLVPEIMAKASVVYNPILYVLLNAKFRVTLIQFFSWSRVGNVISESSNADENTTGVMEIQTNSLRHRDI